MPFDPSSVPDLLAWWDASTGRFQDISSTPTTPASPMARVGAMVSRAGSATGADAVLLAPDSGHRPIAVAGGYDGQDGPGVYCDADGVRLVSTINLANPYTIVIVYTYGQSGYVYKPVAVGSTDGNSIAGVYALAYANGHAINGTDPAGTDVPPTRLRVAMIIRSSSTAGAVAVNGTDMTTDSGPSNDWHIPYTGSHPSANGHDLTTQHLLLFGRYLTDTEVTSLDSYLRSPALNLVCDGNSLTAGFGLSDPRGQSWPAVLATSLAPSAPTNVVANVALTGATTPDRDTAATTAVDPLYRGTAGRNVLTFWEGRNDTAAGATGAQCYAHYVTYCTNRKGVHPWKIVLFDVLPESGSMSAEKAAMNALLADDFSVATADPYFWLPGPGITYADGLVKLSVVPELSDSTNATYFQDDDLHLKDAGEAVVAARAQSALAILLAPPPPPSSGDTDVAHAVVHWPGTFTADATLAAASLANGAGLAGDAVAMTGVFCCLVTVAVTAPAGTHLNRVYYAPLGAVDATHYASPPSSLEATTGDPGSYQPVGSVSQRGGGDTRSDGTAFRHIFRVYGDEFPAFKNFVYNDSGVPVTVTVSYQLTTAV